MPRRLHRLFIALGLVLAAAGCSSVDVKSDPATPADAYATYAWYEDRAGAAESEPPPDREELAREIEAAADAELTAKGMRRVPAGEARAFVRYDLQVAVRPEVHDPYYAPEAVALVEDGTLAIELRDAASGERLWRGSGRIRLRTAARGVGVNRIRYIATGDEPEWRVPEVVRAILAELPPPAR